MTGQPASAFEKYIAELVVAVRALPEVIGLVLLGSTADRARVDQWSDHDFAVIVEPGAAAHLLGDPSWLPESTNIAMVMPDSPDGRRVMYSDGRMLEYAITDLAGLATWFTNEYEVVLDRGGVAQAWADVAARPKPSDNVDPADEIRSFLSVLYFGVAMARRGELIVAGAQVRTWSLAYLLRAWPHRVAAEGAWLGGVADRGGGGYSHAPGLARMSLDWLPRGSQGRIAPCRGLVRPVSRFSRTT